MNAWFNILAPAVVGIGLPLSGCESVGTGTVTQSLPIHLPIQGQYLSVDSTLDTPSPSLPAALLCPYKKAIDNTMQAVVGNSERIDAAHRSEAAFPHYMARMLQLAATRLLGHETDMGLINVGAIRSPLPQGDITMGHVFEMLPFDNYLCMLTMKGSTLRLLFKQIAQNKGMGVSGITADAIVDNDTYTIATIDYVAQGNDHMTACLQADKCQEYHNILLRDLFCEAIGTGTVIHAKPDAMGESQYLSLPILHTADMHSRIEPIERNSSSAHAGMGGMMRRATLIARQRSKDKDLLLFDCGDFSQGTPYYNLFKGEIEIKLMNLMSYDAITIGNHEFDSGVENLARLFRMAQFPVVCANYDVKGTPLEGLVKPYVVLERKGLRMGVFGLSPRLKGLVQAHNYKGVRFKNPIAAARKVVKQLRHKEHCDLVICLSHLGYEADYPTEYCDTSLVSAIQGIDLILGGHSHTFHDKVITLPNALHRNTHLFYSGKNGVYVGQITLQVEQNKIINHTKN